MGEPLKSEPDCLHAVQFYRDDQSLCRLVARFISDGFANGDPAVIIATPEHRNLVEQHLSAHPAELHERKRLGDLVFLDARETLAAFMVEGMPHAGTFNHVVGHVIEQVCRGRQECTVRAYGEMVDLLWKDGLTDAAVRLETLWNELANTNRFSLLCGYSMGNFYKGAAIEDIKAQHSHVVSDAGHLLRYRPNPT